MIAVHNLHKTYGTQTVLAGVNANFAAGRLTSLIGPNGAGKTTLLMMIARLMAPSGGDIRLDGRQVGDIRCATTPSAWPPCARRRISTCA